jgi:hypothetical protein
MAPAGARRSKDEVPLCTAGEPQSFQQRRSDTMENSFGNICGAPNYTPGSFACLQVKKQARRPSRSQTYAASENNLSQTQRRSTIKMPGSTFLLAEAKIEDLAGK